MLRDPALTAGRPVAVKAAALSLCRIKEMRGIRCWVTGSIIHDESGTVLAEVEAVLCDMTSWL